MKFFLGALESDNARKPKMKKRKRNKHDEAAFDTLQLSDGGIVSYELCAKR